MQVYFQSRRELAPTIWQYNFTSERPLHFVPGQYVSLYLPHVKNDPRGSSRTLTIVSLPGETAVSFIVKHPEMESIYKQTLAGLTPGSVATITDPMGDVVLPKLASIPLVFVAGGIGLASFVSILTYLEKTNESRRISLLYSRRPSEAICQDLIKRFPFVSKLQAGATQRLSVHDILKVTNDDAYIYLSGGQRFVEDFSMQLRMAGIGNERIVFDFFDGYRDGEV